jgi:hypothetical protein
MHGYHPLASSFVSIFYQHASIKIETIYRMVKRFLNKRNEFYNTKKNAFLHSGWRERGSVKRIHRNDFRNHLYRELGKKARQLGPKESQNFKEMVNGMVDKEMEHYEMFEKANSMEKPKRMKNGQNVTKEVATKANVDRMQKYIEEHPELMNEKEFKKYQKKKHQMTMNEVISLASKLRIRATNQAIEEADAVFRSAAASATGKPLSPSRIKAKTLKNLALKENLNYRYSKSKKKIVKKSNYNKYTKKHKPNHSSRVENNRPTKRAKRTTIQMKNVKKALPSPTYTGPSAAAAAASVPPVSPQNSNNNNYKNNSNSNSNSNSNRNEFRMRNWQK